MQQAPGYDFAGGGGTFASRMGAHGNTALVTFSGDRVVVTPGDGSFALHVRTRSLGRRGRQRAIAPVESFTAQGQEVVLRRTGVHESFLAGPLGLEHSYLVELRPEGAGELAIEVSFQGLTPTGVGAAVELRDSMDRKRALYRDVAATDSLGRVLAARMEVVGGAVWLLVDDRDAQYPVTIDPLVVTLQGKLLASGGVAGDYFGRVVSISDDTVVVGADSEDGFSGAAHVFVRSGASWTEQAKLTPTDAQALDYFGSAVSISGDTAVVGASRKDSFTGAAYVFVRSGGTWVQQAKLMAGDAVANDEFGGSVSVSGDTVLVGAARKSPQGAAYVFVRSGNTWSEQVKIAGSYYLGIAGFGTSVSLSGDTAVVSAPWENSYRGGAYVLVRSGTLWSQQAKLTANDGIANDRFGNSTSIAGDSIVVGAPSNAGGAGAAYVFVRSGAIWLQQAKLIAGDASKGDSLGWSVSLSADRVVASAPWKSYYTGAAYAFVRSGTSWSQQAKLTATGGAAWDTFGVSVALSGDTAVVGEPIWSASHAGAAYVYVLHKGLGDTCSAGAECDSGFCVDGVCCDSECGSSSTVDCVACSQAAGGATNGTCGAVHDDSSCSDGSACTMTDLCQSGTCAGTNLVTCAAVDACHEVGTCDPGSGACSTPAKSDGTPCDDGNACTQTDTCQLGQCAGANAVVCLALDDCHDVGSCDSASGQCGSPAKVDGAPCAGGACQSGLCVEQDAGSGGAAGYAGSAGGAGSSGAAGAGGSGGKAGGGGSGGAGSAGTSGAAGSGGSAGDSGKGGAAGSSGHAGANVSGSAGAAGVGDAGSGVTADSLVDAGGCGCRASHQGGSNGALLAAGVLLAALRTRRHPKRRQTRPHKPAGQYLGGRVVLR